MQAVSEDRDAAQLMGVNVNATISLRCNRFRTLQLQVFCSARISDLTPCRQVQCLESKPLWLQFSAVSVQSREPW